MGGCRRVVSVGGGSAIDTGKAVAALLTNGGDKPDPYDFLEVGHVVIILSSWIVLWCCGIAAGLYCCYCVTILCGFWNVLLLFPAEPVAACR